MATAPGAKADSKSDDTEKEANAKKLMDDFHTSTQAETICAYLGINPSSETTSLRLKKHFKGENVAFPRDVVFKEVERILNAHINILPKCDENFKKLIIGKWREAVSPITLPARFTSDAGLLFGQYIPRFDNRITTKCPISGAKAPSCHTREFLDFRWKSLLSNMAFPYGTNVVSARANINATMRLYGSLSKTTLKKVLKDELGELPSNYESMFITDEMCLNPKSWTTLCENKIWFIVV